MLALSFCKFFVIGRYPYGPRGFEFSAWRKASRKIVPQPLRTARQCELRFRVVHHHDVAHAGSSGASAQNIPLDQRNVETRTCAGKCTCRADNAASRNNYVVIARRRRSHSGTPKRNGSSCVKISEASAVIYADPVISGRIVGPCARGSSSGSKTKDPWNTVPSIPSWRQICPGLRMPSAARQANFALVPVPH